MKPFGFYIILLFIALTTSSCKKIPVINTTNSSISFKVDGVYKEAKGIKNVFALYSKEQTILQIVGNINGTDEQQIGIMLNNFHGVGEYNAEDDFLGTYNTPEIEDTVLGMEGKVKITEYIEGKSIKGEFQFKGQAMVISMDPDAPAPDTKVFTEGKFEAKVTAYSGPLITP